MFVFSVVKYEPFVYMNYQYPVWGERIGWMMALSSIIVIPGYAIYLFIVTPGNVRQVIICTCSGRETGKSAGNILVST